MNEVFYNAQAKLAGNIAKAYEEFEKDMEKLASSGQVPAETPAEDAPDVNEAEPEAEDEAEAETEIDVDLQKMKKPELLKYAEENGIELANKKAKKDAIIGEIKQAFADGEAEPEAEDAEEPEEEQEETKKPAKKPASKKPSKPAKKEEPEEELDTVVVLLDEDDEEVEVDLEEYDKSELKELAEEYGITVKKKVKKGIIKELLEGFEALAEEAEDESEEEAEDEAEEQEDVEEDVEAMYGLDEMENDELVELLEAYDLSVKGKRQALVSRIVDAINDGTIEVEEEGE